MQHSNHSTATPCKPHHRPDLPPPGARRRRPEARAGPVRDHLGPPAAILACRCPRRARRRGRGGPQPGTGKGRPAMATAEQGAGKPPPAGELRGSRLAGPGGRQALPAGARGGSRAGIPAEARQQESDVSDVLFLAFPIKKNTHCANA